MSQAQQGDTVTIDYTVTTSNGTVVSGTAEEGPQSVTIGQGRAFPEMEAALVGMSVGENKKFTVAAENAFGPRRPELVAELSRSQLPAEPEPQPGMQLSAKAPDGQEIILTLVEVGEDKVIADGNHPLAGEALHFDLTLKDVQAT